MPDSPPGVGQRLRWEIWDFTGVVFNTHGCPRGRFIYNPLKKPPQTREGAAFKFPLAPSSPISPPKTKPVVPKFTESHQKKKKKKSVFFAEGRAQSHPLIRRPFTCHRYAGVEKELKPQGRTAGQNGVPEAVRGVPGRVPRGLTPCWAPARLLSPAKHGPTGDLRQLVGSPTAARQAAGEASR